MVPRDEYATLYLRNVPVRLVREAKVKAAREGTTLTAVVIDALARSLGSAAQSPPPVDDQLRESMQWYEENRDDLLQRYPNEYLAILDGQVMDHGVDFESLATRVFARLGTRPIFMPHATELGERARVRSPRRRAS